MVNTRAAVKREREKQPVDPTLNDNANADKQLTEEPKSEKSKLSGRVIDKTFVATEPVAGTSNMFVLNPAEIVPPRPPASRHGNSSKSKRSSSTSYQLMVERKKLEISAAEEKARIQMALVEKKLAAELTALEEKYSHTSSKSSEMANDVNEIEQWIDRSQQAVRQAPGAALRADERASSRAAPAKVNNETDAVLVLAQALNNLTSSASDQNKNLISRLSTPRELPSFNGDAMEWLNFKQAFEESTEVCNFSTKENQWRLRKSLVGPAREAVSALLMSGALPDTIMSTLELQFGNPDIIIARIMNDIKKLPPLPHDYIGDIVKFSIKIKNFVAAVKTLGRDEYLQGVSICSTILSKMPTALLAKWSDFNYSYKYTQTETKLNLLSRFLTEEATKITEAGISILNVKSNPDRGTGRQHTLFTTNQQAEKCKFCKLSPHSLVNCKLFRKSLRKERWNFVRNNGICFKCLQSDHDKELCQAPVCEKESCGQPHHMLLHYPISKQAPQQVHNITADADADAETDAETDAADAAAAAEPLSDAGTPPDTASTSLAGTVANVNIDSGSVLLKVVRVNIHSPKGVITTHAILDDGASVSLISADIVNKLSLTGKRETLRLRGAWNSGEISCESELIDFKLTNGNNETFNLRARKITELNLPVQKLSKINIQNYEYLRDIQHDFQNVDVKPQLLIGQDNYHLMMPLKIISRRHTEPCATLTPLGWCVHGLIRSPIVRGSLSQRTARCKVQSARPAPPAPYRSPAPPALTLRHTVHTPSGGLTARAAASAPLGRTPPSPARTADLPDVEEPCFDEFYTTLFIDSTAPVPTCDEDKILHEMVRNYFTLESIGISHNKRENKEHLQAIAILDNTAKIENGRWEVGLPWKNDVKMTNSYFNAEKRFKSIEKKLRTNEEYAKRYRDRVKHLFTNDYAREVTEAETGSHMWYLPHFGVDNPRKNKLRLVFDAAAISQGASLNDYLLQGPDLLQSLYGIMLRFRENRIGVTGDIRDMFLRIKIRSEDQLALQFLWRDSEDQPIKKYAMTSLIFGANCSPFVAQYIKNRNAQTFAETKPQAVQAIMLSHYMDDYIDSLPTESEAINMIEDISMIHKQGGFEIRGWTSNNKNVLSHLPEDQLSTNGESLLIDGENKSQRTLGLLWDPTSDSLSVDVSLENIPDDLKNFKRIPTKREILRIVMSIYDIYGMLAPITVKGKILLRSIWKTSLKWDEIITNDLFIDFKDWINDLKQLSDLRLPRWYFSPTCTTASACGKKTASELELHVFCDAAPTSYSAVAYWRLINKQNGNVCVAFITCKNRIAPTKLTSVPRLELQGALLAARLAKTIKDEHRIKPDRTFYWTDSTTVLHWIKNENRNYKDYIANRLGEIDLLTTCLDWHYVPTQLNIADLATKKRQHKLHSECEWFKGPAFLHCEQNKWPTDILAPETNNDNIEIALLAQQSNENINIPDPARFSSWIRLLRATAAVLKFIYKMRKYQPENFENITLERAEVLIIKYSQMQSFSDEILLLKEKKSLNKNHLPALLTLCPYLDEHGVMRANGRIDAASDVEPQMKKPIILDGRNYITRLIVKFYHENAAHGYQEMIVNELKQKYYIIRMRPTVKAVTAKCLVCKIKKSKPLIPRMGELPEGRMAHHQRPFSYCGVDLFGPMEVTIGRRREKRYGVLFTCLTIRAVHIELVSTLSTDSLILALRRMAARRGWPQQFFSDNGTNMKGADVELQLASQELDHALLNSEVANRGVKWSFIPPASPHMGGAWERLIRCIKTTLKVTLKERAPREEVLATLLAEAENMANSRPLTHVSVDPDCPEGLTPNHFLLGSSSNLPQMGIFNDSDFYLRRQWRISQRLADMYWSRWVKEVLPMLLPRQKWQEDHRALQVGDLVLIADPNAPRNFWARGLIQKVCPGKDGRVRTVHVKTKNNVLVRPAARVVRLPL